MKPMKLALRIWIAITAVLGFLGGWATLAHAGKPAPLSQLPALQSIEPLPTLAPIPSLNNPVDTSSLQSLPAMPQIQLRSMPRLRTGGS